MKNKIFPILFLISLLMMSLLGCPDREPSFPVEINRPRFKSVVPVPGTLAVPISASLQFQFSEPMILATFENRVMLQEVFGDSVTGTFTQIDSTVIFSPQTPMKTSTVYKAALNGRLRDQNMNTVEVNGDGAFADSILIAQTWFFTEGGYSSGGFNPVYLRDRKEGSIRIFTALDSLVNTVSGFTAPEDAAVSPDGRSIIVANTGKNEIVFVNTSTLTVEKSIAVAATPSKLAVYGDYVYVASINGKAVTKINLSTLTLETKFSLAFFPGKLAVSTDGKTLFTFDQVKRDLYLLDATTGTTIGKLPIAIDKLLLGEIRVNPYSDDLYICDTKGLKIRRTDSAGSTLQTVYTFSAGNEPVDMFITQKYHFVVAGKTLYKYDAATNTLIATLGFSTNCKSVMVLPSEDVVYIVLATIVEVMDAESLTLLSEVPLASSGIESLVANPVKIKN